METVRITHQTTPETISARHQYDHAELSGRPREAEAGSAPQLGQLARSLSSWLARRRQQRVTREALISLSDRTLADIGIRREDIPLVAKGLDPEQAAVRESGFARWLHERHGTQQFLRELMSQGERDEAGMRGHEIPPYLQAPRIPRAA